MSHAIPKSANTPRELSPKAGSGGKSFAPTVSLDSPKQQAGHRFGQDTELPEFLDRATHAGMARFTKGVSPAALAGAYLDWMAHLATSPGKQIEITQKAFGKWLRLSRFAMTCAGAQAGLDPCIEPLPQDRRFRDEAWQKWPYNVISQGFLLNQQWWHNVTTDVRGVTR
ncbi:poly-beta-hydroxybutyrate polymerase N-terminal domain-containing protein, partial [Sedimentitalea nanhaiensis]